MQYYRCQCGARTMWSSMGVQPCQGCPKCNTTLSTHPDWHRTPEPHQFAPLYDQHTGKLKYEMCSCCGAIKEEEDHE